MTTSIGVQQAQGYNHPCRELLERERRRDYLELCVPLYKALIQGDWESASIILQGREYLLRYSINEYKETPLHIAAASQSVKFVRYLVDMMKKDDLKLQNEDGNTALCIVAVAGKVDMAMIMVHENPELLTIRGCENMMPLHLAASHGNSKMVRYLYDHSQGMASTDWTDDERDMVFLKCIQADIFDVALRILDDNKDKHEFPQEKHLCHVLNILARKTKVFAYPEGEPPIWKVINQIYQLIGVFGLSVTDINPRGRKREAAILLVRKVWKNIVQKPKDEIDAILKGPMVEKDGIETYSSPILFVAAEKDNIGFLVEVFNEYPEIVLKTNDDGHTIFHIAAFHRHGSIYNLLYKIGPVKERVIQLIDIKGNNMLHLAAMNTRRKEKENTRGAALQLQRQLLWFKKIEAMIPPRFIEMTNAEGLTPIEVFTKNHEDLVSKGEKWTKETINQGMVVAALISTIGFAAAFTLPGGYNQDNGFPVFLKNNYFKWFVMMDAISFILSSVSILLFISLVISRYSQRDFIEEIPRKMILGLATLFMSIISLMVAFSASFFIIYDHTSGMLVSFYAAFPIILILRIERNLIVDVFSLTRGPKFAFEWRMV